MNITKLMLQLSNKTNFNISLPCFGIIGPKSKFHCFFVELVRSLEHKSMLTPQDVLRRWFEARRGTSRKVSSWGTFVSKGFLPESAYF